MRATVSSEAFLPALRAATRVVPTRNLMPILSTILLQATDSHLQIAATDLELTLQTEREADVTEPGMIALPARLLAEIAADLPGERVTINNAGAVSKIASGAARFELTGMSPEDFPALPEPEADAILQLPGSALLALIKATAYAVSTDDARPFLTGVLFTIEDSVLRMAATDGGRLALYSLTLPESTGTTFSGILPRRILTEAVRLVPANTDISLSWRENALAIKAGPTRLTSRLIAGVFPTYQAVLDQATKHVLTLTAPRQPLLRAIKRVSIASAQASHVVKFSVKDKVLMLSANAPSVGSASEPVAVTADGDPLSIAFNARFLIDALEAIPADTIRIGLTGAISPALMTPADAAEPLCVLAPVRTYD